MILGIIGNGVIGNIFAYYLRSQQIHLLSRHREPSNKRLVLPNTNETFPISTQISVLGSISLVQYDAIIVPVKYHQLQSVIDTLKPKLAKTTKLILIQNGVGGGELLQHHFPNNDIYIGTTTDAGYSTSDGLVKMTAYGRLEIGSFQSSKYFANNNDNKQKVAPAITALMKCHPNAHWVENIDTTLFSKLAVNAVVNPLTATLNIKNGQLTDHPELVAGLKSEVFAVLQAYGFNFKPDLLSKHIDDVIFLTAENYSSMHQDLAHNRTTEIDGMLGYLLKQATILSVNTPIMKRLFNTIKDKEKPC